LYKISIILPNLDGGGAERIAIYLANDWASRGYVVEFVLMQRVGNLLQMLNSSISVVDLRATRIRNVISPLKKYLLDSRPDVIMVGMWPLTSVAVVAWLLSGRIGRLYLIEHCHLSAECDRGLHISQNYLKTCMRLTYPFATGVIAVSNGVKNDVLNLSGVSSKKIKVIYNPAATGVVSERASNKDREIMWGKGFTQHILSVGSLKIEKNHECLIRAFSKMPKYINAKLTIVGEGLLRKRLESLVIDLGLRDRISLPGFYQEVKPWYQSADLFVLSSDVEGLPTVLIEAMEHGVPIVSTKTYGGGAEEILQNGRLGLLVEVKDELALAAAMVKGLTVTQKKEALIERAKEFSIEKISKQYLDYFKI
jgi:glycosyltransferase involved in cell wall biosynthesis